jgi:hypothetical protein
LYSILAGLESVVDGPQRLADCDGYMDWPKRDLYVFFAADEQRASSNRPRITRVGTHAVYEGSSTSLWDRLRTHRGALSGTYEDGVNHRGSVFRKRIGEAMLHRDGMTDDFPAWGEGSSASRDRRLEELPHERRVSTYIRELPFLWIAVDDPPGPDSDRAYLERNMIALVSNFDRSDLDPRSTDWLGHHSPREEIRDSGLWNIEHVGESYDPEFLDQLEHWVDETESL